VVSAFAELARGWRDFISAATEEIPAEKGRPGAGMLVA
jgi:hypothetical protein